MAQKTSAFESHLAGLAQFASTLTETRLKSESSPQRAVTLTKKIYAFGDSESQRLDQHLQALVSHGRAVPLSCKKGCFWCCSFKVNCTMPEALVVWDYIQRNWSEADREALYKKVMDFNSRDEAAAVFCPLLVDGECGVHPARPAVCRGYNSTDAHACEAAHEDPTKANQVPFLLGHSQTWEALSIGTKMGLSKLNLYSENYRLAKVLQILFENPAAADEWFQSEQDPFLTARLVGN